jgi:hypothetical protein
MNDLREAESFKTADILRLASISHEVDKLLGMIFDDKSPPALKIQARIIKNAINK